MSIRLSQDYWNDPHGQEVKREELKHDRDCFMSRAEADAALEAQGRFKRQNETQITGAAAAPTYPQQPATSPWGGSNPVPGDPVTDTFGADINEVEPILQPTPDAPETEFTLPVSVNGLGPETTEREGIAREVVSTNSKRPATSIQGSTGEVAAQGRSRFAPLAASPQPLRKSFRRRF